MKLASLGWGLVALAVLLAAPRVLNPLFLVNILYVALFASGYNLLVGYTRLISFGHSAFIGTAAYATGFVMARGLPLEIGLAAGVIAAAALGYVMGALAVRRSGIYFGMITLAQSQLLYFVYAVSPFTGGENGMQDVPRGTLLGLVDLSSDIALYYVVAAICAASFLFIRRCVHSPFGHVLVAIRENEERAVSLGYDVDRFKLLAFVLSAAVSGLAGSIKVVAIGLATLSDVHWSNSADVMIMTLVGGIGTMWGPIVGATVVTVLQHFFAERFAELLNAVMGVVFIACVLVFRRGIVGEASAWWNRGARRGRAAAPTGHGSNRGASRTHG